MSFFDRLREMKYIAPSGAEFRLWFDEVERTGGKKAPVTEFPGQSQAAVQDLGELTPTFPVKCYIHGRDYDITADKFQKALEESGPGKLIHPRYGNINVLATTHHSIEKFVEGAGVAVFSITFVRADEESFEYPRVSLDRASSIYKAVDAGVNAVIASVPEEIDDTVTLAEIRQKITAAVYTASEKFETLTGLADEARAEIQELVLSITSSIDSLAAAPAELMSSLLSLYRAPARLVISVQEKITGYATIYSSLADGFVETAGEYGALFGVVASASLAGIILAASEAAGEGALPTRVQAGETISAISDLNSNLTEDLEAIETATGSASDYAMAQAVRLSASAALRGLINDALDLPSEKSITLAASIPPEVLAFNLFGGIDRAAELIEYNGISGDALILIPAATEVRYYE